MKKLLLLFLILLSSGHFLYSQCPKNKLNCSYGCGRHMDKDNDGFCDYTGFTEDTLHRIQHCKDSVAEAEQEKVRNAVIEDSLAKIINIEKEPVKQANKKEIAGSKKIEKKINQKEFVVVDTTNKKDTNTLVLPEEAVQNTNAKPYDLLLVSLITICLYLLTMFLAALGWIKKQTHRRFWNVLLLLTFLVSCLFGFFLVIQINYNILMDWFKTLLYWHVEIGIAMTIISVFHIWWHLRYFKNILKKSK